jgi:hypothetical protein
LGSYINILGKLSDLQIICQDNLSIKEGKT